MDKHVYMFDYNTCILSSLKLAWQLKACVTDMYQSIDWSNAQKQRKEQMKGNRPNRVPVIR